MFSNRGTSSLALVLCSSLGLALLIDPVSAQHWRLPYESQPPFIPVLDLFGDQGRGLLLGAEEVLTGLPAPVTIGNATFVPGVDLHGISTDAFTRFRGDVLIRRGDLYIGRQAVGQSLQNQAAAIDQLGVTTNQLGQIQELHGLVLQGQAVAIDQLAATTTQLGETQQLHGLQLQGQAFAIGQLGQSVQQHIEVLNFHSQVLQRHEQELQRVDQNVQNLGSGVAGSTALAAALTRMPIDLNGAPLACGVGTGGYSSRYAMALGCTVEITPSLAINGGGAYLFGGGANYGAGSLSNLAGALGLVYRFGAEKKHSRSSDLVRRLEQDLADTKVASAALLMELDHLKRRLDGLEPMVDRSASN